MEELGFCLRSPPIITFSIKSFPKLEHKDFKGTQSWALDNRFKHNTQAAVPGSRKGRAGDRERKRRKNALSPESTLETVCFQGVAHFFLPHGLMAWSSG